jgi:hypothetical protein
MRAARAYLGPGRTPTIDAKLLMYWCYSNLDQFASWENYDYNKAINFAGYLYDHCDVC